MPRVALGAAINVAVVSLLVFRPKVLALFASYVRLNLLNKLLSSDILLQDSHTQQSASNPAVDWYHHTFRLISRLVNPLS